METLNEKILESTLIKYNEIFFREDFPINVEIILSENKNISKFNI
jgi:hypothetical protein